MKGRTKQKRSSSRLKLPRKNALKSSSLCVLRGRSFAIFAGFRSLCSFPGCFPPLPQSPGSSPSLPQSLKAIEGALPRGLSGRWKLLVRAW
ncbi:unnamed protein product [Citrullus colocynthis]|uniref:Uncharacterized protein n=1 Tax=Citrullus colocynthis TaxID=252529 RepID=A0ABP0YS42_9ROSI